MKNNIVCLVIVLAAVSCVPSPGGYQGQSEGSFSIAPKGVWLPNCLDVDMFTSKKHGVITGYQKKILFSEEEPTFRLRHDFLSESCKKSKPKVALVMRLDGKITLGEHSDLAGGGHARAVEVEISSETHIPKSEVGLEFFKMMADADMAADAAIDKAVQTPKDKLRFTKLYGFLVVKKNLRNAMHVYLDTQQKSVKDLKKTDLIDSNLYMQYIVK